MPTGKDIAHVVFISKCDTSSPTMIVELKCNQNSDSDIEQTKKKTYPSAFNGYEEELVLVGINYSEKTKDHSCRIERI